MAIYYFIKLGKSNHSELYYSFSIHSEVVKDFCMLCIMLDKFNEVECDAHEDDDVDHDVGADLQWPDFANVRAQTLESDRWGSQIEIEIARTVQLLSAERTL
jgi:hypothetical protein